jgi:hypothetical protein
MASIEKLIGVFEEARRLLASPENDFAWSSWEDQAEALANIDRLLTELRAGRLPERPAMQVFFTPTGPIQEVSLSSGWGQQFVELADRFDAALDACDCLSAEAITTGGPGSSTGRPI